MKSLPVRPMIGIFLTPIGLFLSLTAVGGINAAESMGGPMSISLTPFIQIFLLGMTVPLLYYGTVLARIPSGWVYLFLALISSGWVVSNLWFFPIPDGTYYLLRYGRRSGVDSLSTPGPWEHITAFTCISLFLYWGLTGTFKRAFSFAPHSTRGVIGYRSALVFLTIGLFLALGYLYNLFVNSLGSAVLTAWQQNITVIISFLAPICCLLVSLAIRRYEKIALVLVLSGSGMLLLLTVTFLAYKWVFWFR